MRTIATRFRPTGIAQQGAHEGLYNPPINAAARDVYNQTVQAGGPVLLAANVATRLFAANRRRQMLTIQNLDTVAANVVYVGIGNAPTVGGGIALAGDTNGAGGSLIYDIVCPYTDIWAICAAAVTIYAGEALWVPEAGR